MFSLLSVRLSVCLSVCAHVPLMETKTVKDTKLKFDKHVRRDSPDTTPRKIFEKGTWPGSRDSLNVWALNTNCSITVKDTDFKFDKQVHKDSPDKTRQKIFEKGAWPGSHDPLNFLGVKCQLLKNG